MAIPIAYLPNDAGNARHAPYHQAMPIALKQHTEKIIEKDDH
jgi:hypothetical protein